MVLILDETVLFDFPFLRGILFPLLVGIHALVFSLAFGLFAFRFLRHRFSLSGWFDDALFDGPTCAAVSGACFVVVPGPPQAVDSIADTTGFAIHLRTVGIVGQRAFEQS
jgi:hypothetical protein